RVALCRGVAVRNQREPEPAGHRALAPVEQQAQVGLAGCLGQRWLELRAPGPGDLGQDEVFVLERGQEDVREAGGLAGEQAPRVLAGTEKGLCEVKRGVTLRGIHRQKVAEVLQRALAVAPAEVEQR